MAKNGRDTSANPDKQDKPVKIQTLGQYVRDFSFENIMAQKGISGEVTPEIAVQVRLDANRRNSGPQYDVVCKYSITAKNKAKKNQTLYVLELEYGGLFQIENLPDRQLRPFLLIECPRLLFPFARRIVADMTREGGFPPLNLELIDFAALYRQVSAKKAKDANQSVA